MQNLKKSFQGKGNSRAPSLFGNMPGEIDEAIEFDTESQNELIRNNEIIEDYEDHLFNM